ncbi:hypothetical protein C8F01DRAFT_1207074 [Mycena amicta]|nr:hypothetical protein C8F01DRAFT_1212232 [Mycena amicta]KAJ7069199.1 hypothetical protein C8F01DRAFT_1207074 [Mycena amicta]
MAAPGPLPNFARDALLDAFRTHYQRYEAAVHDIVQNPTDAVVIERLGDDLTTFVDMATTHSEVFEAGEFATLQQNMAIMLEDLRATYRANPQFLRWAYAQRSTAGLVRFLGVSRTTVRNALLDAGIVQPQERVPALTRPAPFLSDDEDLGSAHDLGEHADTLADGENEEPEDIIDPNLPIPPLDQIPAEIQAASPTSYTGPVSSICNEELDATILSLRAHYRRAGLRMLHGMLRVLGHRLPQERIRQSLLRIDPVRRIFERIRIRRREYRVLGPNSLWHHDGQHGQSVHNIRIERLWVDVTAQVLDAWYQLFQLLELRYGFDINNVNHIWLLQFLFLATINSQLAFFAQTWNQHRIQIRRGPNRSPTDMFVFDMFVNGVRGDQLPAEEEGLGEEELEAYGIDWQEFRDENILHSQRSNNPNSEGASSWIGRQGPPADLSQVIVEPPPGTLTADEAAALYERFSPLIGLSGDDDVISLWLHALAYVRILYPTLF